MKVIIALVILYLANFATSYYLHKKYVASQKRVRQYGGVSTARVKGSLRKKGKIVLLAFNEEDDTITYGEKFEGITVFSKFEKIEGIEGLTLDEVESKFEDELKEAVDEVLSKKEDAVGTSQKILLMSDDGTPVEKFYDFNAENLSATATFFKNALEDMMEEYDGVLENNEKIGVLMDVIKKLMT